MRAEVASSFTSASVAIETYSETKDSGELHLSGVHRDGQTINWTEGRCDALPVHLRQTQYLICPTRNSKKLK